MVQLKSTLLALASSGLAAADGLNARAKAVGRYFGTAMSTTVMADSSAYAIGSNYEDFGQYTCENEMKWDATEPSQNSFSYTNADKIVSAAVSNGMIMRCHTLVWHSQLPSWVSSGGFNNATLISVMKNHITNVVTHFKGKCYAWDVVNEALNEDGSLRSSVFYTTIGEAFIPIAFAAAAAADPDAKLYYNDYNCDNPGSKSTGAQNLIKMVQRYGAPIHGMGMQAHLSVGSVNQANLLSNMQAFANLGVEVAYTELDLNTASSSYFTQQATDYATVVGVCKSVSSCVGITIWGFTDKYTWISGGLPLPWDSSLNKKAAYNSILNAWGSSSSSGTTTAATTAATTTSTSSGSTSTSSGSSCSAKWGQCGGIGWTGPTCCTSSTCTYSNDWYSQCL